VKALCECVSIRTGLADCRARPSWRVAVGSRKYDAQLSCGRHLNRTCQVMLHDERLGTVLTVTHVLSS
jgi:hypothetical protein